MTNFPVGQVVRTNDKRFGVVRTEATETATGPVVRVQYLPDFSHLTPTGWADYGTADLAAVRVCECAKLGYLGVYGADAGKLFTTGCDFSRQPSRTSKFLPGHDAKAKGFLVRAYFTGPLVDGRDGLTAAKDLGDKIAAKVAEGIDNAARLITEGARSKRQRAIKTNTPAQREDTLTEAQKLQREHGVTDVMLRNLARALVQWDGAVVGPPAGQVVALQRRGLVSWGHVTTLGRRVLDYDALEADKVACTDDEGSYAQHANKWNHELGYHCRRCGTVDEDN